MDRSPFVRAVARLSLGKRLPDGVYAHVELAPHLPAELRDAVAEAQAISQLEEDAFQVVKLSTRSRRLPLFAYPGFFHDSFPVLAVSWMVDLGWRNRVFRPLEIS